MARSIQCSLLLLILVSYACPKGVTGAVAEGPEEASTSGQEFVPQRAVTDLEQNRSRDLLPLLKAAKLSFRNHDDDHSNIELDKLDDANRYEILPVPQGSTVPDARGPPEADAFILARLVDRMLALNRASHYGLKPTPMIHQEHKRNIRTLAGPREDKDYSFVAYPHTSKHLVNQQWPAYRFAQKLRDLILSRQPPSSYMATEDQDGDSDQPLQVDLQSSGPYANNLDVLDGSWPWQRQKRRRCKIDPNLGVKNPSFCDTDAYFGAADYSMRDVWDSAGR